MRVHRNGLLLLSAVATLGAVVAVAAGCASTDGGSVPEPAVSSVSPSPDAEAYLREICGSAPPTADGTYLCLGHPRSLSPSDVIFPGYGN